MHKNEKGRVSEDHMEYRNAEDYMRGWRDEKDCRIPPAAGNAGREPVVIRTYVEPIRKRQAEPVWDKTAEKAVREAAPAAEEEDATVLLDRQDWVRGYLRRASTGEEIRINENPFLIGKAEDCSYCIRDNATVSRRHARIRKEGNRFLIEDLSSANGTYVDGEPVHSEVQLVSGSELRISGEIFYFRLEIK